MKQLVVPLIVSAALAVSACHKKPETETTTTETRTVAAAAPTVATPAPATPIAPANSDAPAPVGDYDTSKAVVSTVKLGAFPYFTLPDGYVASSAQTLDLARFPFWVGDHFVWIEGKVYQARITPGDNKTYSEYEVQKNVESLVAQAGGTKIVTMQLPSDMRAKLDPDAKQVDTGLGDIISSPVNTYLIHRADKDIWINFTSDTQDGNWAIVETKAFVPTAKLLQPDAPKPSAG